MSDRPTPETDAKVSPCIGFYSCATVPADFARKLERERDEAREALQEIANASHFDNIGNWARNRAKKSLEAAK